MTLIDQIIGVLRKAFCAGPNATSDPEPQSQPYAQQPPVHQQQQQQPVYQQPYQQQGQQNEQQYPPLQHAPQQHTPQHPHGRPQQHDSPHQHRPNNQEPGGFPQPPSSPPHKPDHRPYVTGHQDQNQVNQHDENYMALRARANQEGDQMARCFDESHDAYNGGDGARAKQLSDQGKAHKSEMERLNKQASDWIFVENNKDSGPGEIDLHGLYVKEAIYHTDEAIQAARGRGDNEVHLIVGKGLHSQSHVAKLKPAIEELMQKHQLMAELDPNNSGVLIVHLNGRGQSRGPVVDSDEIARRIEKRNDCIIM